MLDSTHPHGCQQVWPLALVIDKGSVLGDPEQAWTAPQPDKGLSLGSCW